MLPAPSRAAGCLVAGIALLTAAMAQAEPIGADDLAKKQEGGYVTGLPLVAYSTDIGLGGGARTYYYRNGKRTDPRFGVTPYLHRIFVQAFASTRGVQFHWLDYDAPQIAGSPYRVRSQLIFARNINANYFGQGEAAMAPLRFPGAPGQTFADFATYADAQRVDDGGTTFAKYDQVDVLRPLFIGSVERSFADDRVRVLAGLGVSYARVDDYTGETVDATGPDGSETRATQAPTRLRQDCDAGRVVGCAGGRDNYLRLGISYDTRDFEPDPNRGVFVDLAVDVGSVALASEYDYVRVLGAARGYWSPFARHDLVLAGRALLQWQSDGTPFFGMSSLPFTEDPRQGLGGHRTLRGYRQDRFVGPVMSAVNLEARWTFAHTSVGSQRFAFIAAPFVDVGRVWDDLGDVSAADWRPSYGGALRISWNLATIITVDYGVSSEDSGFYVNFGHIF